MRLDDKLDGLATELRVLGRSLPDLTVPADLIDTVAAQVAASPPLARSARLRLVVGQWFQRFRRRLIMLMVVIVAVALGAAPPVRAAVGSWLGIGGVLVRQVSAPPTAEPTPGPPSLPGESEVPLDRVGSLVDFPVRVPAALGPPSTVTVSQDRRVVAMTWHTERWGTVHLDQFDGSLSYVFVKESWGDLTPTTVGELDAYWFDQPHFVIYRDAAGTEHRASARLAGRTLVVDVPIGTGRVTYRLEGDLTMSDAVTIMGSLR